jgi:hypothetical protein
MVEQFLGEVTVGIEQRQTIAGWIPMGMLLPQISRVAM